MMSTVNKNDNEELMDSVLSYIHTNYNSPITLSIISMDLNVEVRNIKTLFNKCLNTSFSEYLQQYRLTMACELLTQTNISVTEICKKCGIDNSYFSKVFKKYTGLTPKQYRNLTK